jgi:uncharacterized protein (DUF305 family)
MKPALALPALLLLAACGAEMPARDAEADHATMDHSGHDMGAATPAAGLTEAQMAYKAVNDRMHTAMATIPADADVAFMQGMLAHHKGAVEMSEVALKHAEDAEVRDLAARVIAAQKPEIAEMEAWLKARGVQ